MVASWEYNEIRDRSCYNVRSDKHRFKSICTSEGCAYLIRGHSDLNENNWEVDEVTFCLFI